jgi:hypothetical protein
MRVLRDGPALRVRRERSSDQLFPLRRLSRVVVQGPAEWDTAALLGCAEAGIPIVFLGADGLVRATVAGAVVKHAAHPLNSLFDELCEEPARIPAYRDWVAGLSQQARHDVVREHGKHTWPLEAQALLALFDEKTENFVRSADLKKFSARVTGMLRALVSSHLVHTGIAAHRPALAVAELDLITDLSNILSWALLPRRLVYIRRLSRAAERAGNSFAVLKPADAARFFESQTARIAQALEVLLRRLHIRLQEALESYGR